MRDCKVWHLSGAFSRGGFEPRNDNAHPTQEKEVRKNEDAATAAGGFVETVAIVHHLVAFIHATQSPSILD